MQIDIAQPRLVDLLFIAHRLRASDLDELGLTRDLEHSGGRTRLATDAWASHYRRVAYLKLDDSDREPVFAFGVNLDKARPRYGQAWGFGTDHSPRVLREVTRYLRKRMIPELLGEGLQAVQALGDPVNSLSARWLGHLGFAPIANLAGIGAGGHDLTLWVTTADAQRHQSLAPAGR